MPLYEFKCENCGYNFDKLVMRHDVKVTCPTCGGGVKKLMSTFAVGSEDKAPGGTSWLGCSKC